MDEMGGSNHMKDLYNVNASERRTLIKKEIYNRGEVRIEQLRDMFNVSEVTIRRDLEILESQNMIRRIRGGAIPNTTPPLEILFQERLGVHTEEKIEIANAAASMVKDGQVVMLSAGTTTTYIARELIKKKELTVVTTAINIAMELAGHDHITLIMIGGIIRKGTYETVGYLADEALSSMNADWAFVGVDGVDLESGFTTPNLLEGRTDSEMLRAATHGVIVADSSKFGKVTLSPIVRIHEPYLFITDSSAPEEYVSQLRERGCNVLVAGR